MQSNMTRNSETDQMDRTEDVEPELGDKAGFDNSSPSEANNNQGQDVEPQNAQTPAKRTQLEITILMTTLCVSSSVSTVN